ncbi:MAG: peptide deformylase, partial [Chloroflexus sp.]|nr:peptide deformylase [Chloroflexus sp.]
DHLNGILFTERIRDLSTLRDITKEREPQPVEAKG